MFALKRPGTGAPIVFVHGFCQSSAYWSSTLELIGQRGAGGYAVDLPGFGESSALPGPYTMAGLADALAAQLDVWKIERITLVGGSMGGVVAQHFALRHPARVGRLLLVATGGFTPNAPLALEKVDQMAAAAWEEATVAPVVDGFFHQRPTAEKISQYRKIALAATKEAALEAARSNATNRSFDQLASIGVPTMIIQGRHDRARTPEHGAAMRDLIPGCVLEVIEDAGHTPQLEQPQRFHDVALPFLLSDRRSG